MAGKYNIESANCGSIEESQCLEWQAERFQILEAIAGQAEESGWDGEAYFMDYTIYPGPTTTIEENARAQARNAHRGEQHVAFRFRKELGGRQYTLTVNRNSPQSDLQLPFVMLENNLGLASHRGALYSKYSHDHSRENLAMLLAEAASSL